MTAIATRVTPSLHPENVRALPEYGEDVAPYLVPVVEALDTTYQTIDELHALRDKASRNAAWTDSAVILMVSQAADKARERLCRRADTVMENLRKGIKATEDSLQQPLQQRASAGTVNEEVRRHVKAMDREARGKFLTAAMDADDGVTLTAVLGAPSYLAGLSAPEHAHYLRQYHERRDPAAVRKLAAMKAGLALVESRAPLIFIEVEKAVGASQATVRKLREANSAAEQALALLNARNA